MYSNKKHFMAKTVIDTPFASFLDKALDGRTNRWLANRTGIHESDISKLRRGVFNPTNTQITKINTALNTNFTING